MKNVTDKLLFSVSQRERARLQGQILAGRDEDFELSLADFVKRYVNPEAHFAAMEDQKE